jgi:hypothetical protein
MPFTRLLMSAAALVLGSVGVACLFAPDLVLASIAGVASPGAMLLAQVLGTLSLGFAVLDWMWKGNRLGGIYGRPIVLANALHLVSTALVMFKALSREPALRARCGRWPRCMRSSPSASSPSFPATRPRRILRSCRPARRGY